MKIGEGMTVYPRENGDGDGTFTYKILKDGKFL